MAAKYSPIVLYCRGSSSARSENVVARRNRTNACGCVRAKGRDEKRRVSLGALLLFMLIIGGLLCV